MFKLRKKLTTLTLAGMIFTLGLPAHAKTLIYRGEAEVQLRYPEDEAIGNYVAKRIALLRAYQQAQPLILKQDFVKDLAFTDAEKHALSVKMASDTIVYPSTSASNPLFKSKITYNTLDFPKSFLSYSMQHFGELSTEAYIYNYHQQLTQQAIHYLNKLNQITDANAAKLLRLTEGKTLLAKVEAEALSEEGEKLIQKERYAEAMTKFESAIAKAPAHVGYRISKISVLVKEYLKDKNQNSAKLDQAIKLTSDLIDTHPKDSLFYFLRAAFYMYQDVVPAQGVQDLQQAIALGNKREYPMYYTLLGLAAKKSGQKTLSRDAFKEACKLGFQPVCGQDVDVKMNLK